MRDEILAHLHDVIQAGRAIRKFIAGRSFEDYADDELLRSAVERKFEIMGNASIASAAKSLNFWPRSGIIAT